MADYVKFVADSQKEAEEKAAEYVKGEDPMRSPAIYTSQPTENGKWLVVVKVWGLD